MWFQNDVGQILSSLPPFLCLPASLPPFSLLVFIFLCFSVPCAGKYKAPKPVLNCGVTHVAQTLDKEREIVRLC